MTRRPRPPRTCERVHCDQPPRFEVSFYKYKEAAPVFACEPHALWWVRGWDGMTLGTRREL